MSPYEKLYRERPILSDLKPFECRGAAWIPVSDKNHRRRGQQVIYIGKDFNTRKGARFYHPPSVYLGTSGHTKWDPDSLYDPKLTQSTKIASAVRDGTVENFEYLVGTTHYDDEDGLLYLPTQIFDGSTPNSPCILGKRSPILPNGLVPIKHSTVPTHDLAEKVLKSDRVSNGQSSISELDSSASTTVCPSGNVVR